MNAKELRIGNYYKTKIKSEDDYNIDQIVPSVLMDIAINKSKSYFDRKPIKLNEEWILKFGYEDWGVVKENEYQSYKRFVLHNVIEGTSSHEVHVIKTTYGGTNYLEYVTSIDQDERQYNWRMEFVHDLQNAVYKETGKDISISI